MQFNQQQPLIQSESTTFLVCWNEKQSENLWEYDAVRIKKTELNYASIVSAIIASRYTADQMQAIINNHLLEGDSAEHEQEFADMQAWRTEAKRVAHLVMDTLYPPTE